MLRPLYLSILFGVLTMGLQNANGDVLVANTTTNNGGSPGWAIFSDFTSLGPDITITSLDTFSAAAANAAFTVEVFVRSGSGLGGPVGSGPGSSTAGWTSLGTAPATQGVTASGLSLPIDIPDIFIAGGQTVGVALLFTGAGPRYFGTGTPPYQTFSDANLSILTGDARSVPFTTGGSFFSSRGFAGSVTYTAIPEPTGVGVYLLTCLLVLGTGRSRRNS
jgi:hypothetical protein